MNATEISRIGGLSVALVIALAPVRSQSTPSGIALDPSAPFVQIVADHVGKRTPLSEFEPPVGLWLRLKNNSRIPIRVTTFEPGTGDSAIGVADEVLGASQSELSGNVGGMSDRLTCAIGKGYQFDVGSPATISPGKSILFSVPLTHVGPACYLRIRFDFELPAAKSGRQPYAFVDFSWTDVPASMREKLLSLIRPAL